MARVQDSSVFAADQETVFALICEPKHWSAWFPWPHALTVHADTSLIVGTGASIPVVYQWQPWRWFESRCEVSVESMRVPSEITINLRHGFCPRWRQTEIFEPHGDGQTRLTVLLEYELPYGLIGKVADDLYFRKSAQAILKHRFQVMREQLHLESPSSPSLNL